MLEPSWFFWGGVMPALIAAAVVGVECMIGGGRAGATRAGGALAVWAGYSWGHVASVGWPPWPPTESTHWLVMVLIPVGVLIAIVGSIPRLPRRIAWAMRIAVAVAIAPALLQSYLNYTWDFGQSVVWLAGLGVAAIVLWVSAKRALNRRARVRFAPLAIYGAIISVGTGMVMMFSGSVTLGQLAFGLTATLGGIACASVLVGRNSAVLGQPMCVGPALVALIGLWINGYFYASMTATNAVLLATSWLAMGIVSLPVVCRLDGWRRVTVQAAAVLLPVTAAVINAGITFSKQVAEPSYY